MIITFQPYVGAGPILFGMSPEAAEHVLGQPLSKSSDSFGPPGEQIRFKDALLAFDTDGRLFQVGFDSEFSGTLLYEGIDILRDPRAMDFLIERDGNPYIWVGFIMLLKLGLRLGGYHEMADEGRTISMFARGRYDTKVARFQPLKM
jgi:hypothetical protein